jgi:uncharacterized protein YbcI
MAGTSQAAENPVETAISRAVVGLYLDKFGKGPRHTETRVHGDIATTVMRDVFTGAEQALIEAGRADSVLTTRMLWQRATEQAFKANISDAAGRAVVTVVSGFSVDDDVATEVFVLAPQSQ